MTISSETNRSGPYNGNGVTTVFDYEFKIVDENHLSVIKRSAVGVETTLAIDADYIVSDVGNPSGGQVAIAIAPANGETITILRNVPFTQETDLENQGAYYAETVEASFDLMVMRDQQLEEGLSRAVQIPASADPEELNNLIEDIIRLGNSADNIDTVANNIGDINTLVDHIGNIDAVAAIDGQVAIVAGISSSVVTVAVHALNVDAVADIDAEVAAVAAITPAVVTVAGNNAAVSTVAGISDDVTTVAQNIVDVTNFADVYQGPKASDPALRNDGSALHEGDLYFNTVSKQMEIYDGTVWKVIVDVGVPAPGSVSLASLDDDLTDAVTSPDTDGSSWMEGKAPHVISRSTPKFLTPEMYIGLGTQIVYLESSSPMDPSGATDFKPAFDAMREEILTRTTDVEWPPGIGWKRGAFGVALQPGHSYALDAGVNFSGLSTRGVLFAGNGAQLFGRFNGAAAAYNPATPYAKSAVVLDQSRVWRAKTATTGNAPPTLPITENDYWTRTTTAILDLIGSAGWIVRDLQIGCDNLSTQNPDVGLMIGTNKPGTISERMRLDNVTLDGWFRKAAGYNYGSEVFTSTMLQAFSYRVDAPAWWIDNHNIAGIADMTQHSGVVAAVNEESSCIEHNFYGGLLRNVQENQWGTLRIDSTANDTLAYVRDVHLHNVYMTNSGVDTDSIKPAIRIKGHTERMFFNIHAEGGDLTGNNIGLSHLVYYDTSNLYNPMRAYDHTISDSFSDAQLAVIDKTNDAGVLDMVGFNVKIGWSRGKYPAGVDAKLFGPNMTTTKARITGVITTGDVPNGFINANVPDFGGGIYTPENLSQIGVGVRRVDIHTTNASGGSYVKQAVKSVSVDGAISVDGADMINLAGSVVAISFTNGARYHKFDVTNGTANFVLVTGLKGPNVILGPGLVLHVSQYGADFFAEPPAYVGTYTPTLFNTTNIAASTASLLHYRLTGNQVEVWGNVVVSETTASVFSELGISLPIASNLALGTDLYGNASTALSYSAIVAGDTTNDRAVLQFTINNNASQGWRTRFSYEIK